jgi:hypothetical protein
MTWTKLDDNVSDHPKVLAVGHLGELTYYRSIIHANRYETDGLIAPAVLRLLCRGFEQHTQRIAQALVSARLWEKCKGGYRIHDFADYQPRRAEVAARREIRQAAGRQGGLRSAAVRRSKSEANAQALASQANEANANPVPSRPVRSLLENRRKGGAGGPLQPGIEWLAARTRMPS